VEAVGFNNFLQQLPSTTSCNDQLQQPASTTSFNNQLQQPASTTASTVGFNDFL
jgi:hypothetical protein